MTLCSKPLLRLVVKCSGCCTDVVCSIPGPDTCDRQRLGQELHWWHYSQKCVGLVCPPQLPYQINNKTLTLISDYFSYVPTIPGPPHSPGNNSYQVKQQADYILCQIFMLIYLQAGSPHHMAPHQNSFVSKVGSEFEFYISISGLIPRTVRHFKGREDSNIRLLLTLLRNLICQEFPKVIV